MDKKDVQIAYFGDHYLNDIQATQELDHILTANGWVTKWHPILVAEELWHLDNTMDYGVNPRLVKHSEEYFGRFFFVDMNSRVVNEE